MKNICIIGSGSWGVALGIHLARIGHSIKIWSFTEEEKNIINNEHRCKFLKDAIIPENVYCTNSVEEAINGSEIILHVTPSKFTRDTVKKYKEYVKNQIVVICSKGFEKETLKTLDEVVEEEMPNVKTAVLSGPSHAEEVSIEIPTALVVASKYKNVSSLIQEEFMSETLRIYTCTDVKGVELGRSIKKYNCILCWSCKWNRTWR